jgi:hypothetical protein
VNSGVSFGAEHATRAAASTPLTSRTVVRML